MFHEKKNPRERGSKGAQTEEADSVLDLGKGRNAKGAGIVLDLGENMKKGSSNSAQTEGAGSVLDLKKVRNQICEE